MLNFSDLICKTNSQNKSIVICIFLLLKYLSNVAYLYDICQYVKIIYIIHVLV